ncbi:MAG TPA: hypothetical protein VGK35_00975 [Actinotalea sp.]|jgi:hypothetical protein
MTTDLRAFAASAVLVAAVALVAGCQSLAVSSSQDASSPARSSGTPSAAVPPTSTPSAAVPSPTVGSEEPAPSPDADAGADPRETLPGAAPGSDACREAYVQHLLSQDPTYFDRRPVEDPIALLTYDRLAGTITADQNARWGMQRLFQPDAVPQEYRLPDLSNRGPDPMTVIGLATMWESDCLSLETQQWLVDYMTPTALPDEP